MKGYRKQDNNKDTSTYKGLHVKRVLTWILSINMTSLHAIFPFEYEFMSVYRLNLVDITSIEFNYNSSRWVRSYPVESVDYCTSKAGNWGVDVINEIYRVYMRRFSEGNVRWRWNWNEDRTSKKHCSLGFINLNLVHITITSTLQQTDSHSIRINQFRPLWLDCSI